MFWLTFRQDLPLARLCPTVRWHGLVQVLKKVLHLASTLALSELVADAKLRGAAVISDTCGRCTLIL